MAAASKVVGVCHARASPNTSRSDGAIHGRRKTGPRRKKGRLLRDALPPRGQAWEGAARLAKLGCLRRNRRLCRGGRNRDLARFLRLGEFTHEVDV